MLSSLIVAVVSSPFSKSVVLSFDGVASIAVDMTLFEFNVRSTGLDVASLEFVFACLLTRSLRSIPIDGIAVVLTSGYKKASSSVSFPESVTEVYPSTTFCVGGDRSFRSAVVCTWPMSTVAVSSKFPEFIDSMSSFWPKELYRCSTFCDVTTGLVDTGTSRRVSKAVNTNIEVVCGNAVLLLEIGCT
ncbi:hypothetical protein BJ741DRAFT_150366 [Chytriomyces cf. hyalinus JEL632]|nr:hypothetical protein BJ741DRAFT_150366 [Chytriomyces cf. hyalinus JEL632]